MSLGKKNHILAIGINKYEHQELLYNPVDDCRKIIRILCDRYQFDRSNVEEIYNEDATRGNILMALERYRKLTGNDNLLIIYSGHGSYDKDGDAGYWIPVDAKEFRHEYISGDDLKTELKAYSAHHVALMVDSCFSGALTRSVIKRQQHMIGDPAAVRLNRRKSRWAMTSGRVELVYDGNAGKNSPFANSIISELKHNDKSMLLFSELGVKVTNLTARNANQTPSCNFLREVHDDDGQFSFVLKEYVLKEEPEKQDNVGTQKSVTTGIDKSNQEEQKTESNAQPKPKPESAIENIAQLKKALRKMFVSNNIKEAYELLVEKLDEDSSHMTTVYLRLAGLNGLEDEIAKGIATNVQQRKAQIRHALDYIINNLEEEDMGNG